MNIDELKQVGEMLANLSGDATTAYAWWIALKFFSEITATAFGFAFLYMVFRIIKELMKLSEKGRALEDVKAVYNKNRLRGHYDEELGYFDDKHVAEKVNELIKALKNEKNT